MGVGRYSYDDFRVVFRPTQRSGTYRVAAFDRTAGTSAEGSFVLPVSVDGSGAAPFTLGRTREVAPADSAPTSARPEDIGRQLGDALLTGPIGELYSAAVARIGSTADRGVRLSLSLSETPQLLGVPWELLFVPPRYLATQRRTPIVRLLEMNRTLDPATIEGPLRMLCVIASPIALVPLDVGAERHRVEQKLVPMRDAGLVRDDWLEHATPDAVRVALSDVAYHIVHFIGHSDFTSGGDGVIFLEGDDGGAVAVDSTLLANLVADQAASLRLVVLNSCKGGRTTADDPQAGVAATLMSLGVPAVVAMQFPISDTAAIVFAEALYQNLIARRQPIDAAVSEARKAVYTSASDTEWATPVLFVRDPLAELFAFASTAESPQPERAAGDDTPRINVSGSGPVAIGGGVTITAGIAGGRDVHIGAGTDERGADQ